MEDVELADIPLPHLLKPGPHTDRFWITTFPKKLNTPLVRPSGPDGQRVIGWGVRINEGLNSGFMLLLIILILLFTVVSVAIYSTVTSDASSAFGFGAFLAAISALYIPYQYLSWKDKLEESN